MTGPGPTRDDLAENRQGRLSQAQIEARRRQVRSTRWGLLLGCPGVLAFLILLGVALHVSRWGAASAAARAGFGIVVVVLPLAALIDFLSRRQLAELRAGKVAAATGRLDDLYRSANSPRFVYLRLGGERFTTSSSVIDSVRTDLVGRTLTIYFLPKTHYVVSMEAPGQAGP